MREENRRTVWIVAVRSVITVAVVGFAIATFRSHPRNDISIIPHHTLQSEKMNMGVKQAKYRVGIALVEVMAATAILIVAVLGALSYEYHASKNAQIAHAQITATHTAQLLLEDWMSTGGSEDYNPAMLGLGFSSVLDIPSDFSQVDGMGSPLNNGVYAITVDEIPMLAMLTSMDIDYDATAQITLRQLGVIVEFGMASEEQNPDWVKNVRSVVLTTYVRADASGG